MNIKQAKQIPIQNFLSQAGIKPAKAVRADLLYLSPFRDERTPSFKVNTNMNTRFDFWADIGGDIIKLVCDLKGVDVSGALRILDRWGITHPVLKQMTVREAPKKKILELVKSQEISYYPLRQYLRERFIHKSIADRFLKEVHFQYGAGNIQKALGFQNDAGAYEVRNRNFKGLVGEKKAISSIQTSGAQTIFIFEWFFDFLAFATQHRNTKLRHGYIVLNSIHGQTEAIEHINNIHPARVRMYLDNDPAGKSAFENIRRNIEVLDIENYASEYAQFKDYSEYWQSLCSNTKP